MGYKTWTDEDLKIAVQTSRTKSDVIRKLGLKTNSSGNFQTIDKHIKTLNLDISHFKGSVGKPPTREWDIKDILIQNSPYASTKNLKRKLLKLGLLKNECYGYDAACGITEWHGKKLSLQLDHINGDRTDNRLENLRLLCPNCHSLTPTFCRGAKRQIKQCIDCGVPVSKKGNRCAGCNGLIHRGQNEKINWPDIDSLANISMELGFVKTGAQLGVSDNSVRKRLTKEGAMDIGQAWKKFDSEYRNMKDISLGGKTQGGISCRITEKATKFLVCSPIQHYLDLIPNEYEGFSVIKELGNHPQLGKYDVKF